MLYGVFMRYVMLPITDWLDVDPVNFFWVEEVGETTLCWLTLIGAAVGVAERSHFTLTLLTHRFPPRAQHVIHVFNNLLIAAFGGLVAWLGVQARDAQCDADLAGARVQPGLALRRRDGRRHPDRALRAARRQRSGRRPTTTSWT